MKKIQIIMGTLFFALLVMAASATGQVVDRILAFVNGDIITLSEYNRVFEPYRQRIAAQEGGQNPSGALEGARQELLERMINELLIEQEARRSGISVKDDEVMAVLTDQLSRRNVTLESFVKDLAREGASLEEYKKNIKDQLIRMKLIRRDVRAKVIITPEEIGRYYEKHRAEYEGAEAVRIRQIMIPVPREANSEMIARLKREAQEIQKRILDGEPFEAMAARYAVGAAAATGGDLGFIERGLVYPEVENVAFGLARDQVSGVIESPAGFHIIKLVDRRGAGIKDLESVREEIKARIEEAKLEKRFEEWLTNLRKKSYVDVRM
ncbi:MAG: peptidylprolyl isomerase [Smithellaceae bacterium]|nr:peptidylprolyl isomerase [Smithellaceae bacterium]